MMHRQPLPLLLLAPLLAAALLAALAGSQSQPLPPARLPRPLLCRHCGAQVSGANATLLAVTSPQALSSRNATLGDLPAPVQLFANPAGFRFEVVALAEAGVMAVVRGDASEGGTFFPGFTWQVCECARCSGHLGWLFRSLGDSALAFYGLILDRLLDSGSLDQASYTAGWVENA